MEKVIDIEERIPSMRKKRRKRTNRKFIFILLIFVVVLLVLLYFQSQASKIDEIDLSGAVLQEKDFYIQQSGISSGDSLWGFQVDEAVKRLESVDGVQEASVSRKWFRNVKVEIQEWTPIAWSENKGQLSLILENGEVFTPDIQTSVDIPIVSGFNDLELRKLLASQLVELDDSVYQLVSEIQGPQESDSDSVILFMDDGYEVHASLTTLADKLSYYPEIVNQLTGSEKGVIDVEVGTYFTPYSKLYGKEEKGDTNEPEDEESEETE